ncbi:VOC family protein [Streptomyces sp. NPDC058525]|uniref:VOC family protein n=1 Tax=Streptomyces sp. NPDC058525 TaxID=3346538 RepID=UPI003655D52B
MKVSHIHVTVRDLEAAVSWFRSVLEVTPGFRDERMAELQLGRLGLVLDEGPADSQATIALASSDCDADYAHLLRRGADTLEPPDDRPWGTRAAYLKGPGAITIEIDQPLSGRIPD